MSTAPSPDATTDVPDKQIEEIFRNTWKLIHRTAYRYTSSWEDAENVLQTIFVRLMSGPLPEGVRQNPKAYLYRAAVNEALHVIQWRKRQKTKPFPEDFEPLEIAQYAKGSRLYEKAKERLYDALEELEPEEAELLEKRYTFGYTESEIASQLGVPRGTIAARLSRIRAKVKKLLD